MNDPIAFTLGIAWIMTCILLVCWLLTKDRTDVLEFISAVALTLMILFTEMYLFMMAV